MLSLQQEKSRHWEDHTLQPESSLRSAQLEKARTQQRRPRAAKNNTQKIFLKGKEIQFLLYNS